MSKKILFIVGAIVLLVVGVVVFSNAKTKENRLRLSALTQDVKAVVVADSTCGCCKLYAKYLEQQGFDVDLQEKSQAEVDAYKKTNNIPDSLKSCHTTRIGKYVIEGHIPMEGISKLLEEKPDALGIGMPGMPSSSPGMPGPKNMPFIMNLITNDGQKGDLFLKI
ncbi:hypothetical protein COY05_02635 [Candidatus Peregrinibacteria bacterium CG_4_10_14_0_2_um_filter_38_24]|nr:MAG: hypothetical protein COY05_02635 [Candidatus Peregrinibacteria bacterium CG_4_10_14_0_2_um_filter_38_24]PJC38540.1 MAG: hypothetical protein CO044_04430 [Candidatus Peregrinibacteria bacterium CG_4_9_14_0_2_um_filter_38_9]